MMIQSHAVNIKYIAPRQGGARTVEGRGYEPYEAVKYESTNLSQKDNNLFFHK